MPLWTTANFKFSERKGWAFESEGFPCVAQRVWPIAGFPLFGIFFELLFETGDPPLFFDYLDIPPVQNGDAAAVIAAVFELLQPFDDELGRLSGSGVTYDSAHISYYMLFH